MPQCAITCSTKAMLSVPRCRNTAHPIIVTAKAMCCLLQVQEKLKTFLWTCYNCLSLSPGRRLHYLLYISFTISCFAHTILNTNHLSINLLSYPRHLFLCLSAVVCLSLCFIFTYHPSASLPLYPCEYLSISIHLYTSTC